MFLVGIGVEIARIVGLRVEVKVEIGVVVKFDVCTEIDGVEVKIGLVVVEFDCL